MNNALPPYVFLPTGLFLAKLIAHKEGEDRSKWVTDFAVQLVEGAGRDDFARSLIDTAVIKQNAAMNRVRRSRAKSELISEGVKNPTRQQIEERLKEIYAEEEITAATTTSEGVDESTTGCNNMRRVPQNEAPAHGFSGGRTAQGTMSRSPEAAAQSGKDYDQETAKTTISTNSPAVTGVNLDSHHTISPDASDGNAEGVVINGSPITRNGSRAACTSATSGQTFDTTETLDKAGAGEVPPENVSKPSPALPVISFGEFGNIEMTNMQYAKLCERFSIADSVLAEADQYFEAQPAKKKKYKNHYAMLLNWCKRRETEAKPKQGFKTAAEKQRDELQKIADYYASKEVVG